MSVFKKNRPPSAVLIKLLAYSRALYSQNRRVLHLISIFIVFAEELEKNRGSKKEWFSLGSVARVVESSSRRGRPWCMTGDVHQDFVVSRLRATVPSSLEVIHRTAILITAAAYTCKHEDLSYFILIKLYPWVLPAESARLADSVSARYWFSVACIVIGCFWYP